MKPVNFNVKRQGDKFLIVTDQGLLVYPATSPAKAVAVLEFLEDAATPYREGVQIWIAALQSSCSEIPNT